MTYNNNLIFSASPINHENKIINHENKIKENFKNTKIKDIKKLNNKKIKGFESAKNYYPLDYLSKSETISNDLELPPFLPYHIGFNSINQPLRNSNLQLRSEIPNSQVLISPWLQTTIEPDMSRRAFDL